VLNDGTIPFYLPASARAQIAKATENADDHDARFLQQLIEGFKWQTYVANAIGSYGLATKVHPLRVRPERKKAKGYGDSFDVLVGYSDPKAPCENCGLVTEWYSIEVKARTRAFTTPKDFPFPTVMVEPLSRYKKRKGELPDWYCIVSQLNQNMMFISTDSADEWEPLKKLGREYITARTELFVDVDQFVKELQGQTS
jgi:hypothetical protein